MNQRFDVFRREDEHFIKWVGIAKNSEDVSDLIRTDSESTNTSEDEYVVVHSTYDVSEGEKPLFESYITLRHS